MPDSCAIRLGSPVSSIVEHVRMFRTLTPVPPYNSPQVCENLNMRDTFVLVGETNKTANIGFFYASKNSS